MDSDTGRKKIDKSSISGWGKMNSITRTFDTDEENWDPESIGIRVKVGYG